MPDGHDADAFRKMILDRFDMSLGTGLGKLAGKIFRIGHLGDFNDLMLVRHAGGRRDGARAAPACRIAPAASTRRWRSSPSPAAARVARGGLTQSGASAARGPGTRRHDNGRRNTEQLANALGES